MLAKAKAKRSGGPAALNPLPLLAEKLKAGDHLFPYYLLYGEDTDDMEAALDMIRASYLRDDAARFNETVLSGFEHDMDQVLALCQAPSLLAGNQLVVVRHAEAYFKGKGDNPQSDDPDAPEADAPKEKPRRDTGDKAHQRLQSYLEKPARFSLLVLLYEGEPNHTFKAIKTLEESGQAIGFHQPRDTRGAYYWLKERMERVGMRASDQVLSAMVDHIGLDTVQLKQNITKLALYLEGKGGEVPLEAVEQVVIHTKVHSIYALQDAVSSGDLAEAIAHLRNILRQKDYDAVRVLVWLQIRLRQLYHIAVLKSRGLSGERLFKAADIKPWLGDRLLAMALRRPPGLWAEAVAVMYEADRLVKSSPLPAETRVEEAVVRVCRMVSGG